MEVKIYQLNDSGFEKYGFMGWDFAKDKFSIRDYECVYTMDLGDVSHCTRWMVLDDIFYIFNQKRPEDFRGHSLSVSDVVELIGSNWYDEKFYCDKYGWEEIKEG